MVNTGLWSTDDSANTTSSTLLTNDTLVNGDITASSIPEISGSSGSFGSFWSIGIDQGCAYDVSMVSLYDDGSAGSSIFWLGAFDSLALYQSEDNAIWTGVHTYQPIHRMLYSGSAYVIHIACDTTQRYLKLCAHSGSLRSSTGEYIQPTEITTWQSSGPFETSGSTYSEIIVGGQNYGKKKTVLVAYTPIPPTSMQS